MANGISVVIITKNEERNIAACLESVAWANDLIVVDSYSDDATVEIALRYTERVVQREWPGMVGPQRNVGLDMAREEWVLFLDADERVTEELRDELLSLVRSEKAHSIAAAAIPRKNYFFGKWLRSSYPDYTSRFLRREAGSYNDIPGRGFDTLLAKGNIVRLKEPLIHLTGESLSQRVRKLDFDSSLQAEEKFLAGKRSGGTAILLHALFAFCRVYFLKKSLLEGTRGLVYAALAAFNTFLKYSKLWEKGAGQGNGH